MANKIINTQFITDIADAIRTKYSSTQSIAINNMPQAIVEMPSSKSKLAQYIEGSLTQITPADLPNLTSIRYAGFSTASDLVSAEFSDTVTTVNSFAFGACKNLKSITFGTGLTSMGNRVFGSSILDCDFTFKSTTPPTIQSDTFVNTTSIKNIYVPEESVAAYRKANYWATYAIKIKAIPSYTNSENKIINDGLITDIANAIRTRTGITEQLKINEMPEKILSITVNNNNSSVFEQIVDGSITQLGPEIFEGATCIRASGFLNCTNLTLVIIPNSIQTINKSAFSGCSKLAQITIGTSTECALTSIGDSVFYTTKAGLSLRIYAITPPTVVTNTFSGSNISAIFVPSESVNTYKTTPIWRAHADHINPIP